MERLELRVGNRAGWVNLASWLGVGYHPEQGLYVSMVRLEGQV